MPPTLREYQNHLQSLQEASRKQAEVNVGVFRAAELRAVKLTGSQEWDSYLQQCQALLNEAKENMASWLERLAGCVDEHGENGSIRCRMEFHSWKSRHDTIQDLMQLPTTLIAEAGKVTHGTDTIEHL